MTRMPTLFISHGSPDTAIADTAAAAFLKRLADDLPRPRAIVVASAHFEATGAAGVTVDARPETIHDFGGFARELYEMQYPAPGDPALAERIVGLIEDAGLTARSVANRGFDHGTWVPLALIYPDADIPVVQVSVDPDRDAAYHLKLGEALAPLAEDGILVIGSGSFTHNLGEAFKALRAGQRDVAVPEWVSDFAYWMDDRIRAGDHEALSAWEEKAPHALKNHPTPEHLMPLFVAAGASRQTGKPWRAEAIHSSSEFGALAMDAYAFH